MVITARLHPGCTHLLNVDRPPSERMGANTSCMKRTPTLYISKRSGAFKRQSTGERSAATGFGGALQASHPRLRM